MTDLKKKAERIKQIQNRLNTLFEGMSDRLAYEQDLEGLGQMSVGNLNVLMSSMMEKLYESKEGRDIIRKYAKVIDESEDLARAFRVGNAVSTSPDVSDKDVYLNEALKLGEGIDRKAFAGNKAKLVEVVKEACEATKQTHTTLTEAINSGDAVYESVEYVLTHKKTAKNLKEYVERVTAIKRSLNEGKSVVENEYLGKEPKALMEDLGKLTENSPEWLSDLILEFVSNRLSAGSVEDLFNSRKDRCIKILDEAVESAENVEQKSQFDTMRKQLQERKFVEESSYDDLANLAELEYTLTSK